MKSRRQFLKLAGTGVLATCATTLNAFPVMPVSVDKAKNTFTLGMAGYSFLRFDVEKTIGIMKRIGVTNLSLKDFHMPMNSTQEQITNVLNKFKSAGINVYTVGVIYMKTKESVDQAFEYAKMAGVKMIVGAPDRKSVV